MGCKCGKEDQSDEKEGLFFSTTSPVLSDSSPLQLSSAHRRPPVFDPKAPIPCTRRGCYAFDDFHCNARGYGEGFSGTVSKAQAAADKWEEASEAILKKVGLGTSGKGDWHALFTSGAIYEVDPNYLRNYGFFQVGGGPFTLAQGLRPHLVAYVKQLRADYGSAHQRLPYSERQLLQRLAGDVRYASYTEVDWFLEQPLDDPESVLELYQRATASARKFWDVLCSTAIAVGLPADDHECPAASCECA